MKTVSITDWIAEPWHLAHELDPLPDAADAMDTCQRFHALERAAVVQVAYDEFHEQCLAGRYRILEWEIFIRDLVPEAASATRHPFQCYFATRSKNLAALLQGGKRKALIARARGARASRAVTDEIEKDLQSFKNLLPQDLRTPYPEIHGALFRSLVRRQHPGEPLLLHDGELTFYSLIWLLRQKATSEAALQHPPRTRFIVDQGGVPAWTEADTLALLEQCGILVGHGNGQCSIGPRWPSLCEWLRDPRRLEELPVKCPDDSAATGLENDMVKRFARGMREGFAAVAELSAAPAQAGTFTDIGSFSSNDLAMWLLAPFRAIIGAVRAEAAPGSTDSVWHGHDHVLFRQARPAFFPWEFLLRSWQPFPTHLLILPIGSSPLDGNSRQQWTAADGCDTPAEAPYALAYVTIAGCIPSEPVRFRKWLASYWALFHGLGSEWIIDQIEQDAKKVARVDAANRLHSASEPFALYLGQLRRFVTAAVEVRRYVDPLTIDTSALEAAKELSNRIFDWKMDGKPVCHRVEDLRALPAGLADELDRRIDSVVRRLDDDSPITKQMKDFAETKCGREDRWLLLHALYKRTASLWVLTGCDDHRGRELQGAEDAADDDARARADSNRALAAVQLAAWREKGFRYLLRIDDKRGYCLGIEAPEKHLVQKWDELRDSVAGYWKGGRQRADEGGDEAQDWARVLRGCAGAVRDQDVDQWLLDSVLVADGSPVLIAIRVKEEGCGSKGSL